MEIWPLNFLDLNQESAQDCICEIIIYIDSENFKTYQIR